MTTESNYSRTRIALAALQLLIGISAIAGGVALIAQPDGGLLDLPVEWLVNSPFEVHLVPGILLLVLIGVTTDVSAVLTFIRFPYAGELAIALGAVLMIWIVMQIWWIGLTHWLQPLYFGLGFLEMALGFVIRRGGRASMI